MSPSLKLVSPTMAMRFSTECALQGAGTGQGAMLMLTPRKAHVLSDRLSYHVRRFRRIATAEPRRGLKHRGPRRLRFGTAITQVCGAIDIDYFNF
jgi:hypothetical protein